jgi:hypothetical protein
MLEGKKLVSSWKEKFCDEFHPTIECAFNSDWGL